MSLRAVRRTVSALFATAVIGAGLGTVATVAAPVAAYADSASMESQFVADMNAARQANGLAPYAVMGDLTSVARQHSQAMASQQSLYHNPNLTTDVHNWQAVGENVGEGPTVQDIHQAFMQSPEHRANILDHDFTQVGVGVVVDKNGTIWVTEDFRQPMSSAPAPAPTQHASSSSSSSTSTVSSTASSATGSTGGATSGGASEPTTTVHPAASPRAVLLHRLAHLRHHPAVHPGSDPVAQAFAYVSTLSQLSSPS